jgi:hypothetical protein
MAQRSMNNSSQHSTKFSQKKKLPFSFMMQNERRQPHDVILPRGQSEVEYQTMNLNDPIFEGQISRYTAINLNKSIDAPILHPKRPTTAIGLRDMSTSDLLKFAQLGSLNSNIVQNNMRNIAMNGMKTAHLLQNNDILKN